MKWDVIGDRSRCRRQFQPKLSQAVFDAAAQWCLHLTWSCAMAASLLRLRRDFATVGRRARVRVQGLCRTGLPRIDLEPGMRSLYRMIACLVAVATWPTVSAVASDGKSLAPHRAVYD